MEIRRYHNPRSFQKDILPALLKHEAENNLPLGILSNLIAGEFQEEPPYLAALLEDGQVELAVIRTPPYPALFSYREQPLAEGALGLIIADLWSVFGAQLSGLTGNKALVSSLVSRWEERSSVQAELQMAMRIYQLDEVQPVPDPDGRLRKAEGRDRDLLLDWYAGFQQEAMGTEPGRDQVERGVDRFLKANPEQRGMVFWEIHGKPVSMAGYSGPTPHGIRIGAVYTPPEHRRHGFATACVAALSSSLLESGYSFCFLFTDLLNPTSNAIYQQIGYRPVSDVDTYHFS
jgi:hypothetical protein